MGKYPPPKEPKRLNKKLSKLRKKIDREDFDMDKDSYLLELELTPYCPKCNHETVWADGIWKCPNCTWRGANPRWV